MNLRFNWNKVWSQISGRGFGSPRRRSRLPLLTSVEIMEERLVLTEISGVDAVALTSAASSAAPTSTSSASIGAAIYASVSSFGSDVVLMVAHPVDTTTGFVAGIGTTFASGEAADSFQGAFTSMLTTMFAWTGVEFTNTPTYGNNEAFQNGQVVGQVWGTLNNIALVAHGTVNLPNLLNTTITAGAGTATTLGALIEAGGTVSVVVSSEAAIAVALGAEGAIALATTGLGGGLPPTSTGVTSTTTTVNVGIHALQPSHNWTHIFGVDTTIALSDVTPYINSVLSSPTWRTVGVAHGPGGVVIGDIIEAQQSINGFTVWVRGFRDLSGNIFVNNAGVL